MLAITGPRNLNPYQIAMRNWNANLSYLTDLECESGANKNDVINDFHLKVTGYAKNTLPSNKVVERWILDEIYPIALGAKEDSLEITDILRNYANMIGAKNAIFIFSKCLKVAKFLNQENPNSRFTNSIAMFERAIQGTLNDHVYSLGITDEVKNFDQTSVDHATIHHFFIDNLKKQYVASDRNRVVMYALGVITTLGSLYYVKSAFNDNEEEEPSFSQIGRLIPSNLLESITFENISQLGTQLLVPGALAGLIGYYNYPSTPSDILMKTIKNRPAAGFFCSTQKYDRIPPTSPDIENKIVEFYELIRKFAQENSNDFEKILWDGGTLIDLGDEIIKSVIDDLKLWSEKLNLALPYDKQKLLCNQSGVRFSDGRILDKGTYLYKAFFVLSQAYHYLATLDKRKPGNSNFSNWRDRFFVSNTPGVEQSRWSEIYHKRYNELFEFLGGNEALDGIDGRFISWARSYTHETRFKIVQNPDTIPT